MKRAAVIAGILVGLALGALPAHAGESSGIKGRVLDVTCPGPCAPGITDPRPYLGDNVRVVVRSLPDRELVAVLAPDEGRFRVRVDPGRYRVAARFRPDDYCWDGSARRVEVEPGEVERVRLFVENVCIV